MTAGGRDEVTFIGDGNSCVTESSLGYVDASVTVSFKEFKVNIIGLGNRLPL